MKTKAIIFIAIFLLNCSRDWETNPIESDQDLKHQPVIEQISVDSQSNIVLYLNYGYSQESQITVERKTIGGFNHIACVRLSQSALMDTSFDKEADNNFIYRVLVEKNGYRTEYSIEKPFAYVSKILYAPQDLQALTLELQGIRLEWHDKSGKEDGYKIEKNTGNGFVELASLPANSSSFLDAISGIPSLPLQMSYRVKAFNNALSSQWAEVETNYTGIGVPTNLRITDTTSYHFTIEFQDNSNIETGYEVERNKNGGAFAEIAHLGANVTRYTDKIFEAAIYCYRVRAKKDNLYSLYSGQVSHNCRTAIPLEGLVAFYPFNGNSNDESGNGNHGTLIGASTNGVLVIRDNGEDRLIIPHRVMNELQDFSVLTFLKINSFHSVSDQWSGNYLVSGATSSNDNSFCFGWDGTHKRWGIHFNATVFFFSEESKMLDNKWHYITFLRSGSLSKLYIDGIQIGNGLQVTNASIHIDAGGLCIGQEQDAVGGSFDARQSLAGEIDNLRFYNRALNEAEIQALYHEGGWGN